MRLFVPMLTAIGIALPVVGEYPVPNSAKVRTVFTTDMEMDDLSSMIRFLLYSNEVDIEGLVYTSSEWHWAGNGNGTNMRWTGNTTIQDVVLKSYAEVYPNLYRHDPHYPKPEVLLSKVKLGNINFESEMSYDTEGSNLIRSLLLDHDPRPVYLQTWGGLNTIARALKSIENMYSGSKDWARIKADVTHKTFIIASGFQDTTYADYIAPNWPDVRVQQLAAGYSAWGYNCNWGQGNTRGLPAYGLYFTGEWIKPYIEIGPYGKQYYSWGDGKYMTGDPADIFGNLTEARTGWCQPLSPYDFLSEGDDVAYFPLIPTGIQDPANPNMGSWGGRSMQVTKSPNLWVMVPTEKDSNGTEIDNYTTYRWMGAAQNDFGARMQWTVTPEYRDGNHPPSVKIENRGMVKGCSGCTVMLYSTVHDPDGDNVTTVWWQYFEEGTYPGMVTIQEMSHDSAAVSIPNDAQAGQTISIILEGTDNGDFPLTRYDRVIIEVEND